MSSTPDYPENVPSAKHGTADSLAAPGRVGAGGTKLRAFAQRYAVELLFVQIVAVILNVAALGLNVTKLLGVCA